MVADDMACNPRNLRPATVFNNANQNINDTVMMLRLTTVVTRLLWRTLSGFSLAGYLTLPLGPRDSSQMKQGWSQDFWIGTALIYLET